MLKNFNNKNNKNKKLGRNKNSDLLNVKDEYHNTNFKTTMSSHHGSNTIYLSDTLKISNSKRKNLLIINNTEKKSRNENNLKIKKIKEENNKEKKIQKRKTQTQTDLFWNNDNDTFFKTYLNKIPNISVIKKRKKENSERCKNKIIYYNSSLEDFYRNKKKECESPLSNKIKSFSSLPRSSKVYFVNNLLKQYKINNKDKKLEKMNMRIKLNKKINNQSNEPEEKINSKILKGFSLLSGNKSALKVLFRKRPIKIRNTLNPIINSYGNILDDLSGKIGFMKDSMNLIYPKVSQAKYLFNGIRDDFDSNQKNRSLIEDYNINQNKIKSKFILYQLKKRKINQTVYSKYPLYLKNNKSKSEKILTAKIYSLRRKNLLNL